MSSLLASDLMINLAFATLGAASLVVGRRAWHGWMGANEQDAIRMWGQALWPAMMRAMPICSVMMTCLCSAAIAIGISPSGWVVTPLVVAWVVTSILYFSVLLINWPRILIPPMHRNDSSFWTQRQAKNYRDARRP